ncbi:MAG: class I SAM-dependent RNA methyltransferase [candidate division Zixibacteria bacterium]|nr:class I SAM-dependent RNA methyltransferase [candidate division Zixibacteria bacterium]
MNATSKSADFAMLAKTLFGLEEILAAELEELGAKDIELLNRAITYRGGRELLYRSNLCLRTATRILQPLSTFTAPNEDALYKAVSRIDWTRYLNSEMSLAIDPVVSGNIFKHSLYVAQKAKDAIVDQFRGKDLGRPSVDLECPDLRINLHIAGSRATLSLDSSGDPLSRRGYRIEGGEAPLSEALAAGIVILSAWDKTTPFVDPMCGSGTLPIEAALIGANIAPGTLGRSFAFQKWNGFDSELYNSILSELKKSVNLSALPVIVGSDINKTRIDEARRNSARAGLEEVIKFTVSDLAKQTPPSAPGTMIVNPPYGDRLSDSDVTALYQLIGDTLKQKYDGYTAFVLTGNSMAAKSIGLRTSRKIKLFNGPTECRLLRFEMYKGSRKSKWETLREEHSN